MTNVVSEEENLSSIMDRAAISDGIHEPVHAFADAATATTMSLSLIGKRQRESSCSSD